MQHFIIRSLILLLVLFTYVTPGQSQDEIITGVNTLPTPTFGIKAGISLGNLYVSDADHQEAKGGFSGGLFGRIPITRTLAIAPEVLFQNQGSRVSFNNLLFGQGSYEINLNYIQLPIMLVYNFVPHFNFHAGAYAAALVGSNIKNTSANNLISAGSLNASGFNRMDYGILAGLALNMEKIVYGIRYNHGLQNVSQSDTLAGLLTRNARNGVVSIYVGLTL
jgi:hypothetical protein